MGLSVKNIVMLGVSGLLAAGSASAACPGDANLDSSVNIHDTVAVLSNYGLPANLKYQNQSVDQNGDRKIDGHDLAVVLSNMGAKCAADPASACPGDLSGDGIVNSVDIALNASANGEVGAEAELSRNLTLILDNWGRDCSAATNTLSALNLKPGSRKFKAAAKELREVAKTLQ